MVGSWGEAVDGLSISVVTDSTTVPLGASIDLEVFFRYWPFLSEGRSQVLNARSEAEDLRFTLENRDTGERHYREPWDFGMWSTPGPWNRIDLVPGEVRLRAERICLLSTVGAQVPPGEYELVAHYLNHRGRGVETRLDPDTGRLRELPFPPGVLWEGVIASGPLLIRVVDSPIDCQEVELPTAIRIEWNDQLRQAVRVWDDWRTFSLFRRPGYHLGCRRNYEHTIGGGPIPPPLPRAEVDSAAVGGWQPHGLLPTSGMGFPFKGSRGTPLVNATTRPHISPVSPLRVAIRLTVFETSLPWTAKFWMPERGDYHVLYEQTIVGVWDGTD